MILSIKGRREGNRVTLALSFSVDWKRGCLAEDRGAGVGWEGRNSFCEQPL